ncbi:DUF4168 domain-containing protein [Brevundimonas goettingensis]|jgi:hypothetical protein|uniref:DUF4168 domain-containing protein n=1 Tax=Brevundimonas goettingensis TaxID=2774190 RepID=A0A975BZK0_9CAUL|nr:DUF4168 domain-containing protein [Brevundimonas goettingensis]QTC90530.1 DUF4168 domain-containing protein [Brevundimonas goettingensis]
MRLQLIAAVSALSLAAGLAGATAAFAQEAPVAAAPAGDVTDAQLTAFNTAMQKVKTVTAAVQGGTPTAEQQAEMAAAVEASGLGVEQFNAISGKVSSDAVLRARLAVLDAPASSGVAAAVTDEEVSQFASAMVKLRELAPAGGATPTPEQQTAMAAAVEESGLSRERFNEVATAVSADARLRARVQLADARRG